MGNPGKLVFAAACLLPALGCRAPAHTVAVIPPTSATMLWEPMHMGAAAEAARSGLHLYWNAPTHENDLIGQRAFVERAIDNRVRGIIFAPDETLGSRTVVENAVAEKIPVVVVDDTLGPPAGPYLSYVMNDEAAGAAMAADQVASLLHGHGSVAILGIDRNQRNAIWREESLERELAARAPGLRIVARRFGDPNIAHEQQIADEVLHGAGGVDAIVALSAASTRGAYYAKVESDPASAVHIVGFDQDLLPPIRTGELDAVIAQNTVEIGRAAMRNIVIARAGSATPPTTLVEPLLLTSANIDSPEVLRLWSFASYPWRQQ